MGRTARIAVAGLVVVSLATNGQAGACPLLKRCACPKAQKRVRSGRKYRCVKRVTKVDSKAAFRTFMKGSELSGTGLLGKPVYTFCEDGSYRFSSEGATG